MMKIISRLHTAEKNIDRKFKCFIANHIYISFFIMFIAMPVLILVSVALLTIIIMLPFSFLFGWM